MQCPLGLLLKCAISYSWIVSLKIKARCHLQGEEKPFVRAWLELDRLDELMGIQDPHVSGRKAGVHKSLFTLFNSVGLVKDTIPLHSSHFSQYRHKENSVQEVRATLLCNYKQVLRRKQCLKVIKMLKQCVTPRAEGAGRVTE